MSFFQGIFVLFVKHLPRILIKPINQLYLLLKDISICMKRIAFITTVLLIILFSSVQKLSAQYYFYDNKYYDNPIVYELGGSVGIINCLTDLGGRKGIGKKFIKDVNFGNTQFSGGLYASLTYKNMFSVRIEGTYGQVKAHDSILKNIKTTVFGRYERNLSFKSTISEISLLAEIHPLHIFGNYEGREEEPPRYSPYLVGGIGYFSFNPQTKLNNNWVDLQPLSTEGQGFKEFPNRKKYELKQICIPVGVGLKYELSTMLNLRAEVVYRILSTDYLDDVSTIEYVNPSVYASYFTGTKLTNALLLHNRQYELNPGYIYTPAAEERGNPNNNDGYFTFNVKCGLILGRERIRK